MEVGKSILEFWVVINISSKTSPKGTTKEKQRVWYNCIDSLLSNWSKSLGGPLKYLRWATKKPTKSPSLNVWKYAHSNLVFKSIQKTKYLQ